jgi:NAD(P)-dependent dehydrogenase (short-subunit alcohol dehydrogenase family)
MRGVLITGCSTGIGKHCAIRLHQKGYVVVATARNLQTIEDLKALGIHTLALDVCDDTAIQTAIDYFRERQLSLYGLFNNAGYGQPGAIEDLNREQMHTQFNTNVYGPMMLIQKALPLMRQQGFGRIIQTSSVLGFVSMRFRGAYNASKYALEGFTDTLRLELKDTNIHAILIQPGPIKSAFRRTAYQRFLTEIQTSDSPHKENYEILEKQFTTIAEDTLPFIEGPEAVFHKLYQALESRSPKARYRVTIPTHVFALLKRCLPDKWLDQLLSRW